MILYIWLGISKLVEFVAYNIVFYLCNVVIIHIQKYYK